MLRPVAVAPPWYPSFAFVGAFVPRPVAWAWSLDRRTQMQDVRRWGVTPPRKPTKCGPSAMNSPCGPHRLWSQAVRSGVLSRCDCGYAGKCTRRGTPWILGRLNRFFSGGSKTTIHVSRPVRLLRFTSLSSKNGSWLEPSVEIDITEIHGHTGQIGSDIDDEHLT